MTHCVLQGIVNDERGIFLQGAAWAPEGRWLRPETLGSSILCTTHNSAMSKLDTFAGEFAKAFHQMHDAMKRASRISTVVAFNGNNLERWLLKTLCGLLASGNGRRVTGDAISKDVHDRWLAVQYGLADFIAPAGLYVPGKLLAEMPTTPGRFAVGPLSIDNDQVVGLQAILPLFHGILVADSFRGRPQGVIDQDSVRRPSALVWTDGVAEHRVNLTWDHGASGTAITMQFERTTA